MPMRARAGVAGMFVAVAIVLVGMAVAGQQLRAGPVIATTAVTQSMFPLVVAARIERAFLGGGDDGQIQMLDTRTGLIRATLDLRARAKELPSGTFVMAAAPSEGTGRLFLLEEQLPPTPTATDYVAVLAARSGRFLGRVAIYAGGGTSHLIIDERTARVFVLSDPPMNPSARITVLDARTGHILHSVTVPTWPSRHLSSLHSHHYTLLVNPKTGCVFVVDLDNAIISALEGTSGRVLWSVPVAPHPHRVGKPIIAPPLIAARTQHLFVTDVVHGMVTMLDVATGRRLRTVRVTAGADVLVNDEHTQRVFVFQAGRVATLDARDGRVVHVDRVAQGSAPGQAAVDERSGHVFLADAQAGTVTMFDGATGQAMRTTAVGASPTFVQVAPRMGRVVIVLRPEPLPFQPREPFPNGSAVVLDGRSGAVVEKIPVGAEPDMLAIDPGTGHALIYNNLGAMVVIDRWGWLPPAVRARLPFLPAPVVHRFHTSITTVDVSQ